MLKSLIESLLHNESDGLHLHEILVEHEVPAKTILLHAGQVSNHIYFIKRGCLRQWFNKDGRDITLQFFFEDQAVASIDSFMGHQPSLFTIKSIEPSTLISISKEAFDKLLKTRPEIKEGFLGLMLISNTGLGYVS
jgi:CRP-like cAMP-binding protein